MGILTNLKRRPGAFGITNGSGIQKVRAEDLIPLRYL